MRRECGHACTVAPVRSLSRASGKPARGNLACRSEKFATFAPSCLSQIALPHAVAFSRDQDPIGLSDEPEALPPALPGGEAAGAQAWRPQAGVGRSGHPAIAAPGPAFVGLGLILEPECDRTSDMGIYCADQCSILVVVRLSIIFPWARRSRPSASAATRTSSLWGEPFPRRGLRRPGRRAERLADFGRTIAARSLCSPAPCRLVGAQPMMRCRFAAGSRLRCRCGASRSRRLRGTIS